MVLGLKLPLVSVLQPKTGDQKRHKSTKNYPIRFRWSIIISSETTWCPGEDVILLRLLLFCMELEISKLSEVVPKAVPKLVPQNAKRPVLLGILQVIGGLLVPRRGNLLHNLSMQ